VRTTIRDEQRAPRPARSVAAHAVIDVPINQARQSVCTALIGRRTDIVAVRETSSVAR
jgi:hypothetical protein